MALSLASISTTERIRAGKSAIPSILEISGMDVAKFGPYEFDGSLPTIASPSGGATQDAEARTAIDLIITALGARPGGVGQFQTAINGTSAVAATVAAGSASGKLRLDPGTDNDGYSGLSLGRHLTGSRNAHCWWHITTPSTLASWKFEAGFTDVVAGTDAGAVNVKATPSFRADDAVVIIYDTAANTTLSLVGVAATVVPTPVHFDWTIVAATEYYVGIELRGSSARGYLLDANARLLDSTTWLTDAVTSTVLLTPWLFDQNRSASQRLLDTDMLFAYQRRSVA